MTSRPSGQGLRPEPVTGAGFAAGVAMVITGFVVHVLASWGLLLPESLTAEMTSFLEVTITSAAGALYSLAAAWWARRRVTPTRDPRDDDGRPLLSRVPDNPPEHDADNPPGRRRVDVAKLRAEYGL